MAVVLVAASGLMQPVAAQGFFESLFGGGGGQSAPAYVPQRSMPTNYTHRTPIDAPNRDRSEPPRQQGEQQSRTGRYRTMCVRMCDGYYFPISSAVNRSRFYRDANQCRSSCGEEAKLFYQSANSGDASEMVDLQGRQYGRLPTAFLYRKSLVDGCKCKPDPWSSSEISRHRTYALNEAAERPAPGQAQPDRRDVGPSDPAVARREKGLPAPTPATGDTTNVPSVGNRAVESVAGTPHADPAGDKPAQIAPAPLVQPVASVEHPAAVSGDAGGTAERPSRRKAVNADHTVERRRATAVSASGPARHAPAPSGSSSGPFGLGAAKPAGRWPGD